MTLGPDRQTLAQQMLARYHTTGYLPRISGGDHDGEGGGENTEGDNGNESTQDNQNDNAKPGGEQGSRSDESNGFKTITSQAELDNIIGKRLDRERKKLAKDIRDEIEAEARTAEAEKQGNYETLYTDLKTEHDTLKADAEAKDTRIGELLEIVKADVDAQWGDIPDEVKELYEGDDDDVLAKRKHLTRSAKLIERLTANATTKPGNGPNPNPAGARNIDVKKETKRKAQQYRF